jgi:choline dehydrogenase-like flavoprotein
MHCVIGSGPAGVACAHALLARGAKTTILDAGVSLEPSRAELVAQLRRTSPAEWTPEQIHRLKEGTDAGPKGIPVKRVYGSDFPYRDCELHVPADFDGVGSRPSLAKGGLSNVWGAAMLPYTDRDIAGWPIGISDLAEHYAAVLKFTGLSARSDDLERFFPLYLDKPAALDLSRQAKLLLNRLEQNRSHLEEAGIHFGQARLAVQIAQPPRQTGCVYCGLCMYGCPYGYIYNSGDTLNELQKNPNFNYQPDIIVTRLQESSTGVLIQGYHRASRALFDAEAGRVYLAAGAIPTTQILLRSMSLYNQAVWMKDSQYFLLPLALARSAEDVSRESLHTLSQLFVEILDSEISPHTVHLQIYSYNDLVGRAVRKFLGPLARPLDFLARSLENRLLVVQGYLHSDHSSRISAILEKGNPDRLRLKAELNPQTKPMIRRVVRKLFRHARHFGAFPVSPLLQIAEPGRGFHTGGAFPMSSQPAAMESDLLGRPRGWQRVHVVDATVLPGIPATTITFSVMANAHRIGWQSADLV